MPVGISAITGSGERRWGGGNGGRGMAFDQDHLLTLIDRIYEASLEPESWPELLKDLRDLVGGQGADYHLLRDGDHAFYAAFGISQDAIERYLRDYFAFSDRIKMATSMAEGRLTTDLDFVGPETMSRNPYYQEFLKGVDTQHCILSAPFRQGAEQSIFAIHLPYGQGPPEARDFRPFAILMPHLRRAGQVQMRLATAAFVDGPLEQAIDRMAAGLLLLDRRGEVAAMNAAAARILARDAGLSVRRRRLTAGHRHQDWLLQRAVARATAPLSLDRVGEALTLTGPDGAGSVSILISPLPHERSRREAFGAIVMLGEPSRVARENVIDFVQAVHGLTPAEARLAQAIAAGTALKDYAEAAGVSINTVRTHLAHIFTKTDTRRQSDLVRLLARAIPRLDP